MSADIRRRVERLEVAKAPGLASYAEWEPAYSRAEAREVRRIAEKLVPELAGTQAPLTDSGEYDRRLLGDTPEQEAADKALLARGLRPASPFDRG